MACSDINPIHCCAFVSNLTLYAGSSDRFKAYMNNPVFIYFFFFFFSDGPRPSQKEIISLRAFMLLFLKQLILKVRQSGASLSSARRVKLGEITSANNYALCCLFCLLRTARLISNLCVRMCACVSVSVRA